MKHSSLIILSILVFCLFTCSCSQESITEPVVEVPVYYLDSENGNDENSGLSPESAWQSLEPLNSTTLTPGTIVLFRAGTVYSGRLKPMGSGTAMAPIIIDMYDEGEKPQIKGGGQHQEALLLENVEYYEVSNLDISNRGLMRAAGRKGVHVRASTKEIVHHIHLKNLYVHDVNGSNVKDEGGGYGIHWSCNGETSRFHDLLIENCHLVRTDRNGITGWSNYCYPGGNWNPSTEVVIRNNLLEDIGGDGIVPIGTDSCLVEYNTLVGGRMRAEDWAAGIWPWGATNTLIQYNEVSGMRGTRDGQSFDSDYECSGTIIQYNYSHDNDGGFLLVCAPARSSYGNRNSIIRYNISQNDGSDSRIFHISGGSVSNTKIYNNTIYSNLDNQLILFDTWEGYPDSTFFYNNIFYTTGTSRYGYGEETNTVFENNVFYGNHINQPEDLSSITLDPMLENPGNGGHGMETVNGYHLSDESPCIDTGKVIVGNGGFDFWGNQIPIEGAPDVGAHQNQ